MNRDRGVRDGEGGLAVDQAGNRHRAVFKRLKIERSASMASWPHVIGDEQIADRPADLPRPMAQKGRKTRSGKGLSLQDACHDGRPSASRRIRREESFRTDRNVQWVDVDARPMSCQEKF